MARTTGASRDTTPPASLPSGVVAFLFTDIEGSTKRWEEHHDAMESAVARHDALLSDAIGRNGGHVFKTVGDAFCAAFRDARQALHAALAAQRLLQTEDFSAVDGLRVRMAIHAGAAQERDGDYFGPTLNRVARLMSIGHGGQVLLSDAARDIVAGSLPDGASLVDLGQRRLKDLMQPERVWQLTFAGLPSAFAPLASLDARPNNLPVQPSALVGRERDLDSVKRILASNRIVTISGAGGVGKTRLALQIGADLIDRFERGVWFADLAPISDGTFVPSAVAKALKIAQSGDSIEAAIIHALERSELLLILDNCEHVLDAAATLAETILTRSPRVKLLLTSRQPLGIAGEAVFRLPSLSMPAAASKLTVDELQRHGATALFIQRATTSDARFCLTDAAAPIVADICRRLDGIPLAIELAAARVRVLSLPNLARRLDDRFKLLTGGSRTALPRQKTLTALIDWSYGLLDAREQALFARLGIFAGSFTLSAALAVCSDEGADDVEVLDLLASLTDKSLLLAETGGDPERFRMLESTRAYALDTLAARGERDLIARRHAQHYRLVALDAYQTSRAEPSEPWLARNEPEIDNLRAALGWAFAQDDDPTLAAHMAGAIMPLWSAVGLTAEARLWIDLALGRTDALANPRAAAQLWLALSAVGYGEPARELAARALETFERLHDAAGSADALYWMAFHLSQIGRLHEAEDAMTRALAIYRSAGPELGVAKCMNIHATLAMNRDDFPTARILYRQVIEKLRALRDERRVGGALTNLGALELIDGNALEAKGCLTDALAILSGKKNARDLTLVYGNLSITHLRLEDVSAAREAARAEMRYALDLQDDRCVAEAALHIASLAATCGDLCEAARLSGYARHGFESLGLGYYLATLPVAVALEKSLRTRLRPSDLDRCMAEGAAWSQRQAIDAAMKV
jgi:predicted ATPase/class 3 adenylate cyclase